MRVHLALLLAVSLSAPTLSAPPVQRPPLATETLFSAGQVIDVDPAGTLEEAALYKALQSLIERYGIEGVNYTDKSVHKDWPITASEARVLLESAHGQLSELVSVTVDNELAENSDDNAAEIIGRFQKVIDISVNPSPTCRLLSGSKYAVEPKKGKLKPLGGSATVRWADAIACMPGGGGMPVSASAYGFKSVKTATPITRGEFLHKLNEALDSSLVEVDLAGS